MQGPQGTMMDRVHKRIWMNDPSTIALKVKDAFLAISKTFGLTFLIEASSFKQFKKKKSLIPKRSLIRDL